MKPPPDEHPALSQSATDPPWRDYPRRRASGITADGQWRAAKLGVSRQTLHAILTEKASITPAMAMRIGKLCGNGPGLWLRMQVVGIYGRRNGSWRSVKTIPTLRAREGNPKPVRSAARAKASAKPAG